MLTGQKLLQDLLGDLDELDGHLSRALIGHNVQELLELIVGLEVIEKLVVGGRQLNAGHHDKLFASHGGIECGESLWEPFEDGWLVLREVNSNEFHVVGELLLEDGGMLSHEIVLEADLIGLGEVEGRFLVEWHF